MLKARRQDNPSKFVLVEESVSASVNAELGTAALARSAFRAGTRHTTRTRRRTLADDDNVYGVQSAWRSEAGKLLLMERSQVPNSSSAVDTTTQFQVLHTICMGTLYNNAHAMK